MQQLGDISSVELTNEPYLEGGDDAPTDDHSISEGAVYETHDALMQVSEAAAAYTNSQFPSCQDPLWTAEGTAALNSGSKSGRGSWPLFQEVMPFTNQSYDFKPKKGKRVFPVDDQTTPCYSYLVTTSPFPSLRPTLRMQSVFVDDLYKAKLTEDTWRVEVEKKLSTSSGRKGSANAKTNPTSEVTFGSERLMRALVWFSSLKANGVRFVPSPTAANTPKPKWNIFWGGRIKDETQLKSLLPHQRINHLPGTWEMGRKDSLALHLRRAQQRFGSTHYGFAPQSYLLPHDMALLKRDLADKEKADWTFILKPPASACGRGIELFKGPLMPESLLRASDDKRAFNDQVNGKPQQAPPADGGKKKSQDSSDCDSSADSDCDEVDEGAPDVPLIQRYIPNPLTINNYKFDLRIYVLCTSFEPLTLFIYNEGLVRFAAHPYGHDDLKDVARHLTNYSINKKSKDYVRAGEGADQDTDKMASKWSLHQLKKYFDHQKSLGREAPTANLPRERGDVDPFSEEGLAELKAKKAKKPGKSSTPPPPASHDHQWDFNAAWANIKDVVIKTFLACLPTMTSKLATSVKTRFGCFELYGFDIMLTDAFEAKLIEVNAMPSLQADSALDKHIKGQLLADCITLVGVPVPSNAASEQQQQPLTEGNNVPWRSQPKGQGLPTSLAFWTNEDGIGIGEEAKCVLQLREDQLRRRGGFDAIYPTPSSLNTYGHLAAPTGPPAPSAQASLLPKKSMDKLPNATVSVGMKFYDVLLGEWERRKNALAEAGPEYVIALREWLLGNGPFPLLGSEVKTVPRRSSSNAISKRSGSKASSIRSSTISVSAPKPSPPPTPTPVSSSRIPAHPPITSRRTSSLARPPAAPTLRPERPHTELVGVPIQTFAFVCKDDMTKKTKR